jgi:hypothetical protein
VVKTKQKRIDQCVRLRLNRCFWEKEEIAERAEQKERKKVVGLCRSFLGEGYKVGQSGWNRGVRSLSTSSSARLVSDVGDKTKDSTDSLFLDEENPKTSCKTKIRRREPTTPCFTANDITTTNILVRPLPTDKRKRMTRTRLD